MTTADFVSDSCQIDSWGSYCKLYKQTTWIALRFSCVNSVRNSNFVISDEVENFTYAILAVRTQWQFIMHTGYCIMIILHIGCIKTGGGGEGGEGGGGAFRWRSGCGGMSWIWSRNLLDNSNEWYRRVGLQLTQNMESIFFLVQTIILLLKLFQRKF